MEIQLMWNYIFCNCSFEKLNQIDHCKNHSIDTFIIRKIGDFDYLLAILISKFEEIGPIKLQSTKSIVVISINALFAYVTYLSKTLLM